jgi:hypothetical protein
MLPGKSFCFQVIAARHEDHDGTFQVAGQRWELSVDAGEQ